MNGFAVKYRGRGTYWCGRACACECSGDCPKGLRISDISKRREFDGERRREHPDVGLSMTVRMSLGCVPRYRCGSEREGRVPRARRLGHHRVIASRESTDGDSAHWQRQRIAANTIAGPAARPSHSLPRRRHRQTGKNTTDSLPCCRPLGSHGALPSLPENFQPLTHKLNYGS